MWNRRMRAHWWVILVCLFVAGACSPSTLTQPKEDSIAGDPGEVPIGLEEADLELPEPLTTPLLSSLEPSAAVVEPGETVSFSGDAGLSGRLSLKSQSGDELEADFENGEARLVIPEGAVGGVYTATVTNEFGTLAIGRVRVASEPGVWLTTDRRYVGTNDQALLRVHAHGVPLDTPALMMVGDAEDEPSMLVPSDGGMLVLSYTPVPLREYVDRALFLPGFLSDQVSVLLLQESESEELIQSNTVQLVVCDQRSTIRGDLGGTGIIRVVSFSGGVSTATSRTQDGEFTVDVPPGQGVLFGWRQSEEGQDEQVGPVWLDVPCGQELEIAMSVGSEAMVMRRTTVRSGDGMAGIRALTRPFFEAVTQIQRPATVPLTSASGGEEPCRKVVVYSSVEGGDARGNVINLAPELAGQLAASLSEAEVITSTELWQAFEYQDPNEDDQDRDTRTSNSSNYLREDHYIVYGNKGFLSGGDTYITLLYGLPPSATDAKVVTSDTFNGSGIDKNELLVEVGRSFRSMFAGFTDRMVDAAICGNVEPAQVDLNPGESTEPPLVYSLTNLAGEDVRGAEVSVEGAEIGRINPETGEMTGMEFSTTYTAAQDQTQYEELLAFDATAGDVRTREGESMVTVHVGGNYRIQASLNLDSDTGFAFVLADYDLQATSCEGGQRGPYKGSLRMSGAAFLTGGLPFDVSEAFEFVLPEGGGPFESGLEHLEIETFYMPGLNDIPGTVLFTVDEHPLLMGVIERMDPEDTCP